MGFFIDVVSFQGSADVFAWKYPSDELSTKTQLIVNEGYEAIFVKDGRALDIFKPGRYTLDTKNIPILSELMKIPFGGKSPFKAEVWFINKTHSLDIKWGTPTPIQIQDPKYNVFIPVRSHGQFGISITNSSEFILKLVGKVPIFNKETLVNYFKGIYLTTVKDCISSYFVKNRVSVLEISAYLEEISAYIKERIEPTFQEYGINLINFYVNSISVPEDDSAVKKLKDALAKKAEMDIVGYNYAQERSFDTLEGAAKNPGSSASIMNAGMGLGMGFNLGGAMGNAMGGVAQNINVEEKTKDCPKCNAKVKENSRFCSECGSTINEQSNINKVKCSKCGESYSDKIKFCPYCGDEYNACSKCKADIPSGASCCPECGEKMPTPCSGCGTILEEGKYKFCPECGMSQVKKCSNCNAQIEGKPKFCPECGGKL